MLGLYFSDLSPPRICSDTQCLFIFRACFSFSLLTFSIMSLHRPLRHFKVEALERGCISLFFIKVNLASSCWPNMPKLLHISSPLPSFSPLADLLSIHLHADKDALITARSRIYHNARKKTSGIPSPQRGPPRHVIGCSLLKK